MDQPEPPPFKVALLWRGDGRAPPPPNTRLDPVFEALSELGVEAEPAIYSEDVHAQLCERLSRLDGVLVWVDPISGDRRRDGLDALLRAVAASGALVSAHPDVILKMGVKDVLHRTRSLGWGADTHRYDTPDAFAAEFPGRLDASGPRVLKQNRGNGGIGVWKVEAVADAGCVRIQEGRAGAEPRILPLADFIDLCRPYFERGALVDQAFQARLPEGMIRCYMSADRVVGFGSQIIRGLMLPEEGPAGPRIMSGPDDPPFQNLRERMEREWTPAMTRILNIDPADLPVIWDADFLYGPKAPDGEDTHVLCEINVSAVLPIPDEAPRAIAETTLRRLKAARERRNPSAFFLQPNGDSHV